MAKLPKRPHAADLHVGKRVRACRKQMGLSQDDLAVRLGLSFQQLQKYERAGNRISASRLYEIARVLGVPIGYFYEGLDPLGAPDSLATSPTLLADGLLSTDGGLQLAHMFPKLQSPEMKRSLIRLIRAMIDEQ